jgi:uncharacterized membrane protein
MAELATTMNRPPYRQAAEPFAQSQPPVNVGDVERWLSIIGGGILALYGLRRSLGNLVLITGGGALIYRGLTGHCVVYKALHLSTTSADTGPGITLEAAITVHKPAAQVYRFWRHLENHPRFIAHLESVVSAGDKRSHWIAQAPMQLPIEWDAEIVEERENALLSWRSLPGADVDHAGTVRFRELPNGRGTEVRLRLTYAPPGGQVGQAVARLFKSLTAQQLQEDLRRCKQIIEAGEAPTVANQPVGQSVSA